MIDRKILDQRHRQVPVNFYHEGIQKNLIQKFWHTARFRVIVEVLRQLGITSGHSVLDIGCNTGYLSEVMRQELGSTVYGMDISEGAIAYAQKTFPEIHFTHGDVSRSLPFEDHFFEVVTAFDILEHIIDLDHTLLEVRRVLKPNGYLVATFPNETILFRALWLFWTHTKGRFLQDVHVRKFQPENCEDIFRPYGFTKVLSQRSHLNMWHVIVLQLHA